MYQRIGHIAIVVEDYDDAIHFYVDKLGFRLIEDTMISNQKRWVVVAPPGAQECTLLLAKADGDIQKDSIGNQTGGRVGFFLFTDDFQRDYKNLKEKGVEFVRPVQTFEYGTVSVFKDLYGNLWDLLQPTDKNKGVL